MERYRNLGGDSGVAAYENGPDFIRVQFSDGSVYLYTYASAGAQNIEYMKQLARGWGTYLSYLSNWMRKA
jgi:hypothetical protein